MMAVGCIQAQRCQTNTCPVGVATQNPRRYKALDVPTKAERVHQFHAGTVSGFNQFVASMGLDDPSQLNPWMLHRRIDPTKTRSYGAMYEWVAPGALIDDAPMLWKLLVDRASADEFRPIELGVWPEPGHDLLG